MAYMSQENKKSKAPAIKAICKKYGVKASLGVRHHSSLVLNIKSGKIDFIGNYNQTYKDSPRGFGMHHVPATGEIQVNEYWFQNHFTGQAKDFLQAVKNAMMEGNYDHSEPQTDYFSVGWYISINIGQWDKPYQYIG